MSKNRKVVGKSSTPSRSSYQRNEPSVPVTNVVKLGNRNYKKVEILPRTVKQEEYLLNLLDDSKSIIFSTGPAGSGKTMLAVLVALKLLKEGSISKIIITRPAVGADDEKHGFLPGDITQKLLPWAAPVMDIIKEYYSTEEVQQMIDKEIIELSPIAFLRGRTFKNSFVICDEMQNSTINSMKMILTRIGENSRMVITGDLNQRDRKYNSDNGLEDFLNRLSAKKSDAICTVSFGNQDIQRHPAVKEVLEIYGEI